jgi:hypothetical protein
VCQSTIKGMLRNMSLLNVRLPGLLPRVECIAALMACIAMDKASSMYSLALAISGGGSPCYNVLRTFSTVWCILLHTALD